MYLGFFQLIAPKPVPLLGVGLKYASEPSKSGQMVWLKPRQVKVFNVAEVPLEEGGSGI